MRSTSPPSVKPVFGPYSPVRQAGSHYFVSGQVGVNPTTKQAAKDIVGQTHQALVNVKAVLKDLKLGLEDVVKTTIYVTDIRDFTAVNEVYVTYFSDPRPARSTVAVKELPRVAGETQIKIEIEAVAFKSAQG